MFCSPPAFAQANASDRAAAEILFEQAIRLLEQNQAAEACPKLEESQRLDPGVGTLLYLADCYRLVGRTASAWATFKEASYAAASVGQTDRQQVADSEAEKLRPQLSYVTLKIAAVDTPDLAIQRNGQLIRKALWGTPIPVDPGSHRFRAEAPQHNPWERTIDVAGQAGNVVVTVPPLAQADVLPRPVAPEPVPAAAPSPGPEPVASDAATEKSMLPTLGWVAVGVGGAGIALGSVFGYLASQDSKAADEQCRSDDPGLCNARGVDYGDRADSRAMLANVGFGVGLAALTTGVVLILTAPDQPAASSAPPVTLRAAMGPGGGGFAVRGGF